MSGLKKSLEELKFDKRMIGINMKNGSISKSDYSEFRSSLGDDSANSENFTLNDEVESAEEAPAATEEVVQEQPATEEKSGGGFFGF